MDLNSGVLVEYCSQFPFGFTDTCVTLELNSAGDRIESCDATYAGRNCDCNVCSDQSSIAVDCSDYDCHATTNGCQNIDLSAEELVTVVLDFQPNDWECREPGTIAATPDNMTPAPTSYPTTLVSLQNQLGGGVAGDVTKCTRKPPNEPRPPPEGPRDCFLYNMLMAEMPDAAEWCICDGETAINCYMDNVCSDGACADELDLVVSIDNGNNAETCTKFSDDRFQETCVSVEANLDGTLMGCNYATYDGQHCNCEICDDNLSISVDCSMYNEYATVTCQGMEGVEPQVLAFKAPPSDDCDDSDSTGGYDGGGVDEISPLIPATEVGSSQDGGGVEGSSLGDCDINDLLGGRYSDPQDKCTCNGGQRVDCAEESYCYHSTVFESSTCAESVETSIDVTEGVSITSCVEFDDQLNGYDFDQTCVEVSVDSDFELQECRRVTYGGQECTCQVCDGGNSIELDCTEYDENAWIPCQKLDMKESITPFVPHYGGSVDGSNERIKRHGCSVASTRTTAVVSTFTAVFGILISYYHVVI